MAEIREHALAGLRLYRRLKRQEFVHYRDEEELFEKAEIAVKKFNAFVMEHSIPPATNEYVLFDELYFFFTCTFLKKLIFSYLFLEKMSRMDVEKKRELSYVMESYWDMLPNEIKEYIIQFKKSQESIDEENKERMISLCHEIQLYGLLKSKWGLGHIKCKADPYRCGRYSHLKLTGCYVNEYTDKCEMYLGHGYPQALSRVNHVKSFL